mmetsp:Transcript_142749/g.266093  ORF Transcript_142749/g.266093 Transcript_142749/m.266093 type:complete len:235 (-) Transcript_142749:1664-2368(-)
MGCAGAPQISATLSLLCVCSSGKSAPEMGYLQTRALRRATMLLSASATTWRRHLPSSMTGKQTEVASVTTAAGSSKACLRQGRVWELGTCKEVTIFCTASRCEGFSSVMCMSRVRHMLPAPPKASTVRPHALSCHRNEAQVLGNGPRSALLLESIESKAAAPAGRGAAHPGDLLSSATNSSAAVKGLKLRSSKLSSPASGQGSTLSSHAPSPSSGPSNPHAKHKRLASPDPLNP